MENAGIFICRQRCWSWWQSRTPLRQQTTRWPETNQYSTSGSTTDFGSYGKNMAGMEVLKVKLPLKSYSNSHERIDSFLAKGIYCAVRSHVPLSHISIENTEG